MIETNEKEDVFKCSQARVTGLDKAYRWLSNIDPDKDLEKAKDFISSSVAIPFFKESDFDLARVVLGDNDAKRYLLDFILKKLADECEPWNFELKEIMRRFLKIQDVEEVSWAGSFAKKVLNSEKATLMGECDELRDEGMGNV